MLPAHALTLESGHHDTPDEVALGKDEDLSEAMQLIRSAQLRWDFVSSENSTGFHSPQESARILADSIDRARQAEIAVLQVMYRPEAE